MKSKEAVELENALNSNEKVRGTFVWEVFDRPHGGLRVQATKGNVVIPDIALESKLTQLQLKLPEV